MSDETSWLSPNYKMPASPRFPTSGQPILPSPEMETAIHLQEQTHFTASSRPAFHFFRVDVTGKGQGDYLVGKIVFAGTLLVLFEKSDLFMTEVILGQWVGVISLL